jgi:hypothetical protein
MKYFGQLSDYSLLVYFIYYCKPFWGIFRKYEKTHVQNRVINTKDYNAKVVHPKEYNAKVVP